MKQLLLVLTLIYSVSLSAQTKEETLDYIKNIFESNVKLYSIEKSERTTTETTTGAEHYRVISVALDYGYLVMKGQNIHSEADINFRRSIDGDITSSDNKVKSDNTVLFIIDDETLKSRMVKALKHLKTFIEDDPFAD